VLVSRTSAAESEWDRRTPPSQSDGRSPTSWLSRPAAHQLPAPPKPRRSRSPGERSSSSSSRSPSRDYPDPDPKRETVVESAEVVPRLSSVRSTHHSSPGYPHVYHPDVSSSGRGPVSLPSKRLPRHERMCSDAHGNTSPAYSGRHRRSPVDLQQADDGDRVKLVRTRASQRRSEEENAPIAKRLRR
jgi:hypothetical protein